jgi:hypothetical protein
MVATDGCLPVALDRLYVAVAALIDPCREMADGVLRCAPSLYENSSGRSLDGSTPCSRIDRRTPSNLLIRRHGRTA